MHLSPTDNHRYLMSQMTPTLRFDGGDVDRWRTRLRLSLRRLLGDTPGERCDLRPRRLWMRDHPLGTIEKVVFSSEPHADVPAYVCLPRDAAPPYPLFICLQGHSTGMHNSIAVQREDETQPRHVEGDRDFAIGCMQRGIAALCIEQRSLGERIEKQQAHVCSHNSCHDAFVQALMLGRTLLGERVFDVDRAIDYLATRSDVDMSRIAVMGNSGGGTTSIYAAATLRRISFAMPSCAFCTFRESKMALYHCSCGYLPGILKYADMADVLGLFAPQPVVVVAGHDDKIIPLPGVQNAFRQLKRIYRAMGAEERCHLVVGSEGHRFYADDAWPVMLKEIKRSQRTKASSRRPESRG